MIGSFESVTDQMPSMRASFSVSDLRCKYRFVCAEAQGIAEVAGYFYRAVSG